MNRRNSALIVFVVLAGALAAELFLDYTDTYVADRFHAAVAEERYQSGEPFSLAGFLDFHDWDRVCAFVPGGGAVELSTQLGGDYRPTATGDDVWSLLFVRGEAVTAEVVVERSFLEPPEELDQPCAERWAAIVSIVHEGDARRMTFVGQ